MAIYDLYGVEAASIVEARHLIERLLSTGFEERDSSFHRGPYYAVGRTGDENIELKANADPDEDATLEDEFANYRFLLFVNNTRRANEIEAALSISPGVKLLRREDL